MQICNVIALIASNKMVCSDPRNYERIRSTNEMTVTVAMATSGVLRSAWTLPSARGSVLSCPLENRVRVTCIRVVSNVDSTTDTTIGLPPQPDHTACPDHPSR